MNTDKVKSEGTLVCIICNKNVEKNDMHNDVEFNICKQCVAKENARLQIKTILAQLQQVTDEQLLDIITDNPCRAADMLDPIVNMSHVWKNIHKESDAYAFAPRFGSLVSYMKKRLKSLIEKGLVSTKTIRVVGIGHIRVYWTCNARKEKEALR